MSPFLRFMLLMLAIDLVGFAVAGLLFPTDRTAQLFVAVPTLTISPVIAFLTVYGRDRTAFADAFGREK